jgi:hypothetical protein
MERQGQYANPNRLPGLEAAQVIGRRHGLRDTPLGIHGIGSISWPPFGKTASQKRTSGPVLVKWQTGKVTPKSLVFSHFSAISTLPKALGDSANYPP